MTQDAHGVVTIDVTREMIAKAVKHLYDKEEITVFATYELESGFDDYRLDAEDYDGRLDRMMSRKDEREFALGRLFLEALFADTKVRLRFPGS